MGSLGVASGCGGKEVYIYIILYYIDFLILLIPTPLVPVYRSIIPIFCSLNC